MAQRADDDSPSQASHTHGGRQNRGPGDDAQVVDGGRQGRQQEVLVGVEDAHDDAAHAKDHRRDQHQAHQVHGQGLARGVKTRGDDGVHQPGSQEGSKDGQNGGQDQDQVDDGAGQPPGATLIIAGQVGWQRWG